MFSNEDRVLIVCARQALTAADSETLAQLLQGTIDWETLLSKARWQKLHGMLYYHLRGPLYSSQIPQGVLDQLKKSYLYTTARHLHYRSELANILQALRGAGIQAIVLKGNALVGTVYGEPGLRPMGDIDLLVPESQAHQAQTLICSLGFRPGGTPEDQEETEQNHRHLPILLGINKAVAVEVHRHVVRLNSPLCFDISGFWERAQEANASGLHMKVLSPEDLVLHLCINFFLDRRFHSGAAIGQLCDIAEVTRHYQGQINWEVMADRVTAYGWGGPVACTLRIVKDLLGGEVPGGVFGLLWAKGLSEEMLARFVLHRVTDTEPWIARELVPPGGHYNVLWFIRAAIRRLMPSRRYMISRYGNSSRGTAGLFMYIVRLRQGLAMLPHFLRSPSSLTEDVSLDRWLHSLYDRKSESLRTRSRAQ